jgi:predicted house-cleaning noncanonical NTP pyrophosphatase (MazG superfamily)
MQPKLIRDRIPEIIRHDHRECLVRKASNEEYFSFLKEKLKEEVEEFCLSEELEEIVDVLEVIEEICMYKKFSPLLVQRNKNSKRRSRGGFSKRYILERVS